MHTPIPRILRGLTLMTLAALTTAALAAGPDWRPLPAGSPYAVARDAGQKRWVCEYMTAADGIPYMFCEDLASLVDDEPNFDGVESQAAAKYFPLWGRPKSDQNALELARILLCPRQSFDCSVELARGSSLARLARF